MLPIAQSVPLLLTNNLLGRIASAAGASLAFGLCATVTALSALSALCFPTLRAVMTHKT